MESGDLVHAYDFEAGQWVEREVEARHDNTTDGKIYQILIGDERIGATPKHPFWVVEGASLGDRSIPPELKAGEDEGQKLSGRWVRADELQVGDLVYQRDGSHSAIQSIDIEEVDGQRVCNLTIHELHNYAVGKLATLVHNGCKKTDVDAPKVRVDKSKVRHLREGNDVHVKSPQEADALLKHALPDAKKVRGAGPKRPDWSKFKGKHENGMYHKDYQVDPETNRIYGHSETNPHGASKHINVKLPDGKKVAIIIEPQ